MVQQGVWLRSVLQGYFQYHGEPGNTAALEAIRTQAARHWLAALRRRSQRYRMPLARFAKLVDRWVPKARVLHPYPNDRFYPKHPK